MSETGRNKFKKIKTIINILIFFFKIFPRSFNLFLLKFYRNTNGALGLLLRYVLIKILCKHCGDNVSIQPGVYLFGLEKISFGENVSIHPMCYIDGAGEIEIGNNVSIAHGTSILSTNHTWNNLELPIKYNKVVFGKIRIANDVWIGGGVRILAGISVGSRSVVAAGAVVNKDIDANTIVGGIPAKYLKTI